MDRVTATNGTAADGVPSATDAALAVDPVPAPIAGPATTARPAESEEHIAARRRDRLLAALTLTAGIGLLIALPFALKAGAEFFLPTTAALVVAIALVPVLEWLERHHIPSSLAALTCVLLVLAAANVALAAIIVPASEFFRQLPDRLDQVQMNIQPVLDLYSTLDRYINRALRQFASSEMRQTIAAGVVPPRSLLELFATSAPTAIVHVFFAVLVVYFFLAGWTRLRRSTITSRASFDGALATARVIQEVVDDTAAYLGTITIINLMLGMTVAGALWLMGMPFPLMWGGIVALLNYIPYFGPIVAALLLGLGGLMSFQDIGWAVAPAIVMIAAHLIEANVITPFIVGHRLTINPVMILVSISFWGWVWGTLGALLAVPLLIIIQTIVRAAGKPDIAGFLFEQGTLTGDRRGRR